MADTVTLDEADIDRAMTLFRAALPFDEIARQVPGLGDADTVRHAIQVALARSPLTFDDTAERVLALERLDAMHRAVWGRALRGDLQAVDRVLKIADARARLLAEPDRTESVITAAFDASLSSLDVTDADAALIAGCRQVARQIDHATAHGSSGEATRALYLLPHLMNGLRELGATPAARVALSAAAAEAAAVAAAAAEKGAGANDLDDFKRRRAGGG